MNVCRETLIDDERQFCVDCLDNSIEDVTDEQYNLMSSERVR